MTCIDPTRLRQLREDAGLTQLELAAGAGVSLRTVTALERGEVTHPQTITLLRLADTFRLDYPALFAALRDPEPLPTPEGDGEPPPQPLPGEPEAPRRTAYANRKDRP